MCVLQRERAGPTEVNPNEKGGGRTLRFRGFWKERGGGGEGLTYKIVGSVEERKGWVDLLHGCCGGSRLGRYRAFPSDHGEEDLDFLLEGATQSIPYS